MVCFGRNEEGQCDVPPDLGPVKAVAAGEFRTCVAKADGEMVCFGCNSHGQFDVPPDLGRVTVVATGDMAPIAQNMTLIQVPASVPGDGPPEDVVDHIDPAANITPEEASEIVPQQSATWIQLNADSSDVRGEAPPLQQFFEPVLQLQFSRSPEAFDATLS